MRLLSVALLAEGVDRNWTTLKLDGSAKVALLAEGVDRNLAALLSGSRIRVALLAEGVDRNNPSNKLEEKKQGRPPRGGRG